MNLGSESLHHSFLQLSHKFQCFKQFILIHFLLHSQQDFVYRTNDVKHRIALFIYIMHLLQTLKHPFALCQSNYRFYLLNWRSIANVKHCLICYRLTFIIIYIPWLAKWQAWILLIACLISPSAIKSKVLKACSVIFTFYP